MPAGSVLVLDNYQEVAPASALQKEFDAGVTNCKLQVTDVGSDGNLAWLVGNFSVDYPTEGGKMATATGNYVSVYRKEADGVWRTVLDTWNDTPAN